MDDFLAHLGAGERVLDLGSGLGSFRYERYPCQVIAVDTELPQAPVASQGSHRPVSRRISYVLARAAALPLTGESVDMVVANHLFEHLAAPVLVVREVARVLRSEGLLFASVPTGTSFTERLYRLWTLGGGHLQSFRFRRFQELIEQDSDLELLYVRRLYSSFSFLRPRPEIALHLPRRAQLLKYMPRTARDLTLGLLNAATRLLDAMLGSRLSFYGWACYFGRPAAQLRAPDREEFLNVCSRCGAGHSHRALRRSRLARLYRCPECRCWNPFFGHWFARRITARPWEEEEHRPSAPGWMPAQESTAAACGPVINPDGVVNAASHSAAIAPGTVIAVFGKNLAGPGAALLVNGRKVPPLSVSIGQLNACLPPDLPRGPTLFQVWQGDQAGPEVRVPVFLTGPGLFSRDETGQGIAATLGDARPGGKVALLATGLGPVSPDGQTTRACRAWIGGRPVRVEYCGLLLDSPQPGIYEVRLQIPQGVAGPLVPVQVEAGGRRSNVVALDLSPPHRGVIPAAAQPRLT